MNEPLAFDRIIDAMARQYRRRLLVALMEHNPQPVGHESVSVSYDADGGWSVTETEAEVIEAHHIHLPRLEEYGYIEWDRDRMEVSKGERWDEIALVLNALTSHGDDLPDDWV